MSHPKPCATKGCDHIIKDHKMVDPDSINPRPCTIDGCLCLDYEPKVMGKEARIEHQKRKRRLARKRDLRQASEKGIPREEFMKYIVSE